MIMTRTSPWPHAWETHGFFQLSSLCHCRHACNLHGPVGTLKKACFFGSEPLFSDRAEICIQCNYRLQCAVAVNVQYVSSAQKSTGPRAPNRHSMPTYCENLANHSTAFYNCKDRTFSSFDDKDRSLFWHFSEPCETIWMLSITARIGPSHRLTTRIARSYLANHPNAFCGRIGPSQRIALAVLGLRETIRMLSTRRIVPSHRLTTRL